MKLPAKFSLVKIRPSGNKCIGCGKCNKICPMDVDVQKYIENGLKVKSTECIFCRNCIHICPVKAIK